MSFVKNKSFIMSCYSNHSTVLVKKCLIEQSVRPTLLQNQDSLYVLYQAVLLPPLLLLFFVQMLELKYERLGFMRCHKHSTRSCV